MTDKRIIIPLLAFNRSGGVRMICAVADGLARAKISTRILVPDYAPHSPVTMDPAVEVTVIQTSRNRSRALLYRLALVRELRGEAGVAVSTGYQTPLLIRLANLFGGRLRMFSLIQGYEPLSHIRHGRRAFWVKPLQNLVARVGFRLKGCKVATSRYVADCVGSHRIKKIINPGISPEFFQPFDPGDDTPHKPDSGESIVGIFPPTGTAKGIGYAMKALEQLRTQRSDVRGVVFDCDYRVDAVPESVSRYTELAAARHRLPTLIDFYRTVDLFVFPSLVEGFGLPPLEAMACGTAVIVANSGGVMDYAEDGTNCLVVPPGNAGGIRDAIVRLLDTPDLMQSIVDGGRETASRFPLDRFVSQCVEAIEEYHDEDFTGINRG